MLILWTAILIVVSIIARFEGLTGEMMDGTPATTSGFM
jgi:hypothetical protein